jgi:hypothetical protein
VASLIQWKALQEVQLTLQAFSLCRTVQLTLDFIFASVFSAWLDTTLQRLFTMMSIDAKIEQLALAD